MALKKIHIDFETYSELNLKEVGAFKYAEDPSTEALILAYSIGDGPTIGVDLTGSEAVIPRELHPLFEAIASGMPVGAHHAQFERLIWTKVLTHFPIVPQPLQWNCTAARARLLALPGSLDRAADAVGLRIRKDPRGEELINRFSKPQKNGKRILPRDDPEGFQAFIDYCKQDVEVERKLDKILPELSPVEAECFDLDYRINDRGMPVNMSRVNKAFDFVEEYSEKLTERAKVISGYRPTQREKTLAFLEERGFPLPNLQAPTVEALAKRKGLPADLVELLDIRIELSRAGTKKLKAIRDTVSKDGRIRGGFLFSAASTRRWSSTGVQMHNLQKPEGEVNPTLVMDLLDYDAWALGDLFDRPLTAIAQSIRGFFEAEGDDVFHVADYSSVEPRGTAWLANEEWMLKAYREKQDLYRVAAGKVYNVDPKSLTKEGFERFMGKQLVLGCGYGMGPPRFVETVAKFGKVISEEEARQAVYGYRNSVPNIVKFWRWIEACCIKATREWKVVRQGSLRFRPSTLSNGFRVLYIDMPSGTIAYPRPRVGQRMWNGAPQDVFLFYTPLGSSWIETDTFGGSLVENVVQALCRDILRDGLLAADKAGHYVVGHVHDEGLAEGRAHPEDLRDFQHHLSNSSPWAKGFPIETDAFMSKVYKK
jgi:DNA polymerase bacteriophage-type